MKKEELAGWKSLETTKKVLSEIQEELDANVAYVISGAHIGSTGDVTLMESCRIAGYVSGLSYIFGIEADDEQQNSE